jgi:hypothetical protein
MFENGEPSFILGPKVIEEIGGWRELHREELHNFLLFSKCY